jgi:mycothiol synthase
MSTESRPEWNLRRFTGRPTPATIAALGQLAAAAEEADGNPPFNDQTWSALRSGDDAAAISGHIAVLSAGPEHDDDEIIGAAIITRGPGQPAVLELVVRPEERGHGVGAELAAAVGEAAGEEELTAWSHGDSEAAASLASRHGYAPARQLWRMRAKSTPWPTPELGDGVRLRPFVPGTDEEAWLALNAAAFAHHPEQGSLTLADLLERERSEWFDPAGFLLAEDAGGTLLGFHWTKVHPATTDSRGGAHPAVGEVYVVGISPDAQGRGLGRALTLAGLRHLADAGLGSVMLYVDADNEPAVRLYRSLGFERWDGDVMYAKARHDVER